jgi:hypothetical protein
MDANAKCYFCDSTITDVRHSELPLPKHIRSYAYNCPICGLVWLRDDFLEMIRFEREPVFSPEDKEIIRICLRNAHEQRGEKASPKPLTLSDLGEMVKQYRQLDPLEKMDKVLEMIGQEPQYVGQQIEVTPSLDFAHYHCSNEPELERILYLLEVSNLITGPSGYFGAATKILNITVKGYERLRELRRVAKDSRQCFVAMWFTLDMVNAYEKAIRPAIEYFEPGQSEPRFRALKIDQKEHTNDINDEIISEIRRSRFMVCDLTGYCGGVYWEAGFARGLGLEVIYTCRDDWIKPKTENLVLQDSTTREVKREGIHFDLEHMNRIEWKADDLDGFRDKLTKRIKAVIV